MIRFIQISSLIMCLFLSVSETAMAFKPMSQKAQIRIQVNEFSTDKHIRGIVTGLPYSECDLYKVVVYARTDRWYIHPYADGGDGLSFGALSQSCSWEINTVLRTPTPSEVAFLLVEAQHDVADKLFDLWSLDYLSIYISEWSDLIRPTFLKPLRGATGRSERWGSGWLELWNAADFGKGEMLRLHIGGTAKIIVIRLLSEGEDPSRPSGIYNGSVNVPQDRIVKIELQRHYKDVVQISVHGGSNPWGLFPLGGANGPAYIISAERVDHNSE